MNARRNERSILNDLFEMLVVTPIWFGPIFAGLVFATLYWVMPWALLPRNPGDITERTISQVIGGSSVYVAPYAAGVALFVWLVAEGKKFMRRRELARSETQQHDNRTASAKPAST